MKRPARLVKEAAPTLPAHPKTLLAALHPLAAQVRLPDEEAALVVKEAARARVEGCLERAIECVKARGRVRDNSK